MTLNAAISFSGRSCTNTLRAAAFKRVPPQVLHDCVLWYFMSSSRTAWLWVSV